MKTATPSPTPPAPPSRSRRRSRKASPASTDPATTTTHAVAVIHSRAEHDSRRVLVLRLADEEIVYQVGPPGTVDVYTSRTSLLKALCGKDPGISFERYFKLDKKAPVGALSTLDMFGPGDTSPPAFKAPRKRPSPAKRHRPNQAVGRWCRPMLIAVSTLAAFAVFPDIADARVDVPAVFHVEPEPEVTAEPEVKVEDHAAVQIMLVDQASGPKVDPSKVSKTSDQVGITSITLGIDLENRSNEVRRLLFAGFGSRIARGGYNPDDVLQEVYRGLLARNYGRCPWDIRKSSFGHYVHMVCGCILANYHRREQRRREVEQVGMFSLDPDGGGYAYQDACLVAERTLDGNDLRHSGKTVAPDERLGTEMAAASLCDFLVTQKADQDTRLAIKVLPYVQQGFARGEIAKDMKLDPTKVGRALARLRRGATEWKATIA